MEKYVPDIYQKSVYDIDYSKLTNRGIKCLLFDLDNTLVFPSVKEPTEELIKLSKLGTVKKSPKLLSLISSSINLL